MTESYRLICGLRQTQFTEVFAAETSSGVVVTLTHPKSDCVDDPEVRHLFALQFEYQRELQCPGLIPLLDSGAWRGMPYLVHPLLPGPTLLELSMSASRQGAHLPAAAVAQIGQTVAGVVDHLRSVTDEGGRTVVAHHGAVSLSNLWLGGDSPVVLGDLGPARNDDLVALCLSMLALLSKQPPPVGLPASAWGAAPAVPPDLWRLLLQGTGEEPPWRSARALAAALQPFVGNPVDLGLMLEPFGAPPIIPAADPTLRSRPAIVLDPADSTAPDWGAGHAIGGGATLSAEGRIAPAARRAVPLVPPTVLSPVPVGLASIAEVAAIELAHEPKSHVEARELNGAARRAGAQRLLKRLAALVGAATLLVALGPPAMERIKALSRGAPSMVAVDSDPPGAEVFSDQTDLGPTPLLIPNDYSPDSTLTLRLEKRGYQSGEVSFRGGREARLRVTLKRSR